MDFKAKLKQFKNMFLRFWRSENNKVSLVRDIIVALFFVLIILLALWTYTGQWFGYPLVAIESSSMQHLNEPFGKIGTINAGDMVFLVKVNNKNDVIPFSVSNNYNYGKKGDVVIYHPDGNLVDHQIIHRAMCWIDVEIQGSNTYYTIEEYGIIRQNASEPLYIPQCGIWNSATNSSVILDGKSDKRYHYQKFTHSGFITKGDNPLTNTVCDQIGGISNQPVKVDWISGKASGELPWIGSINIIFNDLTTDGEDNFGYIPQDSLTCFVIVIIILISIPLSLDIYGYFQGKKQKKNDILIIEEDTKKK
jgi:signal peptidase